MPRARSSILIRLTLTTMLSVGTVGAVSGATASPAPTAIQLSRHPIAESRSWQRYVVGDSNVLKYPKAVYLAAGAKDQVVNPDGLKAQDGRVTTIHATAPGTPRLVLDLGVDTGGYIEVGITKTDGTTVHLGYSETRNLLTADGDSGTPAVSTSPGVPFVEDSSLGNDDDPTARWDDVKSAGNWRSPAVRGAQRWISLQLQAPGTVSIDYVRVRRTHLLPTIADYAGHFLSSDDTLNRVWYASAYTLALDSIPRPDKKFVGVDGAKRDRLLWIGDLVPEGLTAQTVWRQGAGIIKRSLQAFSCQQATDGYIPSNSQIDVTCPDVPPTPSGNGAGIRLPEYTASWVIAVHDYVRYTGDKTFARHMLPVARRAMAFFTDSLDSNELYSTPPDSQNWHPFDPAGGEDSHTNAMIYRGLLDLADLEQQVGTDRNAVTDRTQARSLAAAMRTHLWDPMAGAFLLNADDPLRNHSQDAQVEAVYGGVVTRSAARSALNFITTHLQQLYGVKNGEYDTDPFMSNYVSPYISGTEILARLHLGDTAGALALMRREWGHMVHTDPYTTVWEKVGFDGDIASYAPQQTNSLPGTNLLRGASSFAHGWATGPVPALSGYVLGIRPLTDGFTTWTVAPQPGDLHWAQGQTQTPHGATVSRWRRGPQDSTFVLTAGSTTGRGIVVVPTLGHRRVIAMDGRVVWDGRQPVNGASATADEGGVRFTGVTEIHSWAWSGTVMAGALALP